MGIARMKTKLLDILLPLLLPAVILLHLALAPDTKVEESFNLQAAHDVLVYGTPTGPGAAARLAARYDHAAFPGAVPRTFVGAVVLAGVGQAVLGVLAAVGLDDGDGLSGPACQALLRAVLGLANAAALVALGRALGRGGGGRPGAARWFYALQAAQFHVVFYASRTLPNAFALVLTTLAWAALTQNASAAAVRVALTLLTFAAVVFRAEVALLLAAVAIYLVAAPLASLQQIVRTVALAAAAALVLTVPIDAYFWQASTAFGQGAWPLLLWPELHAFVFNVWHGHASQWGTLPWHWYATAALPRLLLNPAIWLVGLPAAFFLGGRQGRETPTAPTTRALAARLAVPSLLFVALYSRQPHKEARFVLYVVPALTAAAALGADRLWTACWGEDATGSSEKTAAKEAAPSGEQTTAPSSEKTAAPSGEQTRAAQSSEKTTAPSSEKTAAPRAARPLLVAATAALALSVPLAFAASTAMLLVSALNYPGGDALAVLRGLVRADAAALGATGGDHVPWTVVTAHADVLACMTGVTLFGSTLGPAVPSLADALARHDAARAAVRADPALLSPPLQYQYGEHDGAWAGGGTATHQVMVAVSQGGGDDNNGTEAGTPSLAKDGNIQDGDVHGAPSSTSPPPPPPPLLVLDKTEQPWVLRDPEFWAQFDYVLAEDPQQAGGGFEPVAVVHGYAGVEVLRPGERAAGEAADDGDDDAAAAAPPVVGRGALLARARRAVRARTGGWWAGPRTAPRIYVLRRVRAEAGAGAGGPGDGPAAAAAAAF